MPRNKLKTLVARVLRRTRRAAALAGHVDTLTLSPEGRLRVTGWYVDLSEAPQTLLLRVNGRVRASVQRNTQRADVAQAFPQWPQALQSGFELEVALDEADLAPPGARSPRGTRPAWWRY